MLKINLNSTVPIYEQLVIEIKRMIDERILKEGDSLPTIRSLASQLDVAINTVARAYQELESMGFIESRGRRGTAVAAREPKIDSAERYIFKEPIRTLLQKGLDRSDIENLFKSNVSLFFD
ncbi:GntR family transcriptional regulator [candidate division KSB1 bacterium]